MKKMLLEELKQIAHEYAAIVKLQITEAGGHEVDDMDLDELNDSISSLAELVRAINEFGRM